ncbi:MAG: hypothetical protein RR642_12645 [Solibacillus sp.]
MTISRKVVLGILLLAIIIGTIIIGGNWGKTSSDEKLELGLVKSMAETKKEKEKESELLTEISKTLNDKGFGQLGLSYSPDKRVFTVQAEEKDFIEKNKDTLKNVIVTTAKEHDFRNFKVEFLLWESYEISEEDIKRSESLKEISNLISKLLEENGYNRSGYSITDNEILIEIFNGDLVNKEEIEELIANSIFLNTNKRYTVTMTEQSKSQIVDQQWQPIFSAIIDETSKEFKEYRGFSYSFHPKPLQIIIKTNLGNRKWFGNSDRSIDQIEKYTEKIIALKRAELSIEAIPYEIIIRDKNDKRVN